MLRIVYNYFRITIMMYSSAQKLDTRQSTIFSLVGKALGHERAVRPPRELVRHLDAVAVGEAERELLRHGRAITVEATLSGSVAITSGEELLAIAEAHGHELTPRVVLAT